MLRRGAGTIDAAAATAEDARLLALRAGDPLLVERRVIEDGQGRRIEATESRYAAARYGLAVQFDVEGPTAIRRDGAARVRGRSMTDRGATTVVGRLVLDDRVEDGAITIEDGLIAAIELGPAPAPDGPFIAPASSTSTSTAGAATTRWVVAPRSTGWPAACSDAGSPRSCRPP